MTEDQAADRANRAPEARLRRLARRKGIVLTQSRKAAPYGYGQYFIADASTNGLLSREGGMDLDEVDAWFS